jgi:N utilization substance protein B
MEDVMTDQNPKTDTNASTSGATSAGGNRRDVRRLAMQVLYQMDVTGVRDRDAIIDGLDDDFDNPRVREEGTDLAINAWANHKAADVKIEELAPEWPTHRQPPVDRAILRLAFHEITSGHAPVKVAINEAIELAKNYASEQSPAFVNGVLDKLAKTVDPGEISGGEAEQTAAEAGPADEKAWLDDAKDEKCD